MNKQQLLQRLQDIEWDNFEGKKVLACFIPSSNVKPVYYNSIVNTFMIDNTKAIRESDAETDKKTLKTDMKTLKTDMKTLKTDMKILSLIQENSFVTISQLSNIIGVSKSAVNQQIIKMRKAEIIRREGADKGGRWVIIRE